MLRIIPDKVGVIQTEYSRNKIECIYVIIYNFIVFN